MSEEEAFVLDPIQPDDEEGSTQIVDGHILANMIERTKLQSGEGNPVLSEPSFANPLPPAFEELGEAPTKIAENASALLSMDTALEPFSLSSGDFTDVACDAKDESEPDFAKAAEDFATLPVTQPLGDVPSLASDLEPPSEHEVDSLSQLSFEEESPSIGSEVEAAFSEIASRSGICDEDKAEKNTPVELPSQEPNHSPAPLDANRQSIDVDEEEPAETKIESVQKKVPDVVEAGFGEPNAFEGSYDETKMEGSGEEKSLEFRGVFGDAANEVDESSPFTAFTASKKIPAPQESPTLAVPEPISNTETLPLSEPQKTQQTSETDSAPQAENLEIPATDPWAGEIAAPTNATKSPVATPVAVAPAASEDLWEGGVALPQGLEELPNAVVELPMARQSWPATVALLSLVLFGTGLLLLFFGLEHSSHFSVVTNDAGQKMLSAELPPAYIGNASVVNVDPPKPDPESKRVANLVEKSGLSPALLLSENFRVPLFLLLMIGLFFLFISVPQLAFQSSVTGWVFSAVLVGFLAACAFPVLQSSWISPGDATPFSSSN